LTSTGSIDVLAATIADKDPRLTLGDPDEPKVVPTLAFYAAPAVSSS
jgi:hypothetical protein